MLPCEQHARSRFQSCATRFASHANTSRSGPQRDAVAELRLEASAAVPVFQFPFRWQRRGVGRCGQRVGSVVSSKMSTRSHADCRTPVLNTAEFLAEPRSLADVADDDGRNQAEERDGAEQDYELNFDHGVLWSDAA
jgi:hypothetical protein